MRSAKSFPNSRKTCCPESASNPASSSARAPLRNTVDWKARRYPVKSPPANILLRIGAVTRIMSAGRKRTMDRMALTALNTARSA